MTTPELLKKATKRPWKTCGASHVYSKDGNVCTSGDPRKRTTIGYTPLSIASKDFDEACANTMLIARAVNSFEAMREALKDIVATVKAEEENPSVTLRRYIRHAEKALALAEKEGE